MKLISKILVTITILLSTTMSNAQIKNTKTETVKVYGNCGMCKSKIEKAGTVKNISKVEWDNETGMATLTYDEKLTNQDEILKKIAAVGYDSDKFKAPDNVYNNLHGCCQYERPTNIKIQEK
jgi:copper chaperone CopZ